MSDNFLSKLKQIRQKYGITQAEMKMHQQSNRKSFIETKNSSTIQPLQVHRSRSNMKRSYIQPYQDSVKDNQKSISYKRDYNISNFQRPSYQTIQAKITIPREERINQRNYSQPKFPVNYKTIDLQNIKPIAQKGRNYDKTFERTSLLSANIQNLQYLYQPITKPIHTPVPNFSYTRQINENNNWTLDKLSKVQQKIKAYLRK